MIYVAMAKQKLNQSVHLHAVIYYSRNNNRHLVGVNVAPPVG
jgi:hypothetical protein